MLVYAGGRIDVVSVAEPRYTLHTTEYKDYILNLKWDQVGNEGMFVASARRKETG